MNGTSVDGIDAVLTEITTTGQIQIKYLDQAHIPFTQSLRERILKATTHQINLAEVARLHHDLGRFYAHTISNLVKKKKWKIKLVGLHGQTVFHEAPTSTLQIGEASYLASALNVPVVSDFRVADLAVGGQGAPIASLFHEVAFKNPKHIVSVHNLGGMSNLTQIQPKQGVTKAFDTGPANILIDLCLQKATQGKITFDKNGALAKKGLPDYHMLTEIMKHPYFKRRPPKSCGREQFGEEFLNQFLKTASKLSLEDQLATLTELTAMSVAHAYDDFAHPKLAEIIFCGGGAKNKYLISRMKYHMPHLNIKTTDDYGWPSDSVEGAAFALLAAYRFLEKPANIPVTTGAKKKVLLGKITKV